MTRMLLLLALLTPVGCSPEIIVANEYVLEDGTVYKCSDVSLTQCGYSFTRCDDGQDKLCISIPKAGMPVYRARFDNVR